LLKRFPYEGQGVEEARRELLELSKRIIPVHEKEVRCVGFPRMLHGTVKYTMRISPWNWLESVTPYYYIHISSVVKIYIALDII